MRMRPLARRDGSVESVIVAGSHYEARRMAIEQRREAERVRAMEKAKSRTIQILSHEVRNPLQAILGGIELVCETTRLSPMQREYLFDVKESARSLIEILNDVLDMERFLNGKADLNLAPAQMLNLVEGIAKTHAAIATARNQ